jgi:Putative binding domain, N-terminal/Viral BACON domain
MAGERLLRVSHHALVLMLVVSAMVALSAQTVVDPRYVEFNASPDHNTQASDGTPVVSRYSLALYAVGSSVVFTSADLGKPTPDSSGIIRVDFLPLLSVAPTPGVTFEARVSAVGPGGTNGSTPSNGFSFSVPCAPSISPTSRSVAQTLTTGSVSVTAGTGCAWTAQSNAAWISLTGSTAGTGNGTVAYSVAANTQTTQRIGTVTIAGQTFTVTQAAMGCTYSLSITSWSPAAAGASSSTSVTAPTGCAWTSATSAPTWLTITSGTTGSGNGVVSFSAAANPNPQTRTGTLTIGGQTLTVNQAAGACTYSLTPTSRSVVAAGASNSTSVTAATGCAWTATTNDPSWLTITSGASGSGNGSVGFTAAANPSPQARTGTLTIGGQTFTVNQAAGTCSFSLSPASWSVVAAGASNSTSVTAATGCAWTATTNDPSWLTITSGASGSGNGSVNFTAAANPDAQARTGTLTIGGQTFTVSQAAVGCTFSLSPTSWSAGAAGASSSTSVTAPTGCAWTAASSAPTWLTITSGATGNGNGVVNFTAAANSTPQARSGSLSVGGQTFTVNQAAGTCSFSISPSSLSAAAAGASGSSNVTTATGCAWTATTNAPTWLTITSGASGSGNGVVSFNVATNPNPQARTGTLTIAGRTYTVNQAAATCSYSISPSSLTAAAAGATGSTTVTTTSTCAWTASSSVTWITITGGANGTGSGPVTFTVSANPSAQRSGTLTVAGRTFTVTQSANTCSYALSPASRTIAAAGGSSNTFVTTTSSCAWQGTTSASWITITSSSPGGSGALTYTVAANPDGTPRTGTITVGTLVHTVNQNAAAVPGPPAGLRIVVNGGSE